MIVVTAGSKYMDIDALAGCIAQSELLKLCGENARAVSTAPLNESVTPTLRSLKFQLSSSYKPSPDDRFIVVDVSDPSNFDPIVDTDKVIKVIDHHFGTEQLWKDKLGPESRIEPIGAVATLVVEDWRARNLLEHMDNATAQLLAAAILDNTLYFRAEITTKRDKDAYSSLASLAKLDNAWAALYFSECQEVITADLTRAVVNDTKMLSFRGLPQQLCVGQLAVWDAAPILQNDLPDVAGTLRGLSSFWLANIINISDGHSYFVTDNAAVKSWAQQLLGLSFNGETARADRLWLRKEIMKQDQS